MGMIEKSLKVTGLDALNFLILLFATHSRLLLKF